MQHDRRITVHRRTAMRYSCTMLTLLCVVAVRAQKYTQIALRMKVASPL